MFFDDKMATKRSTSTAAQAKLEQAIKTTRIISTVSLAIGIIAIVIAGGPLVLSLFAGPAPNFGSTLAGINTSLTPAQLAVFNNASNSYFEIAGEMYLNGSLQGVGGTAKITTNTLMVNGKPAVIYLGAISCIYCGENRWAMALALGKLGHFNSLYNGYSALQDGDVPTIYWKPAHINATSGVDFGANYTSNYISFVPIEYVSNIRQGFQLQALTYFQQQAQLNSNSSYLNATNLIISLNNFQGTPYTVWGRNVFPGADAIAFTNGTRTIMNMTHADVIRQLANPNNVFAWQQYAGADLYIASVCATISNTAPICSLPAISGIERLNGY